jgi:hypothetical protein
VDEANTDRDRERSPFAGKSGWWNRVNRRLYPVFGPAQVTRSDRNVPEPERSGSPCPVCGRPMTEHTIERGTSSQPSRLHCPA